MLTPNQAAERPHHIGASELGALFGQDERMSRYQLWHVKAGLVEAPDLEDNGRVFWGQVLEPAIAQGIAQLERWEIRPVEEYRKHPEVKGWGASLDFEITNLGADPVPLEIKNVDRLVFLNLDDQPAGWIDYQPPVRLQLQVQGQIGCTSGARHGVMAVLVGGNDPKIYHYDRHDGALARIAHEIPLFWRSIEERNPPPPDFEADLATIQAIYRTAEPDKLERFYDERLNELATLYKEAAARHSAAEKDKDRCKGEILHMIGDVETALTQDWKILAANRPATPVPAHTRSGFRDFRIYPARKRAKSRRK